MRRAVATTLLGAWALAACVPDYTPASELGDRPQVVAIRATPPEVAPGDEAILQALLHTPGAPLHYAWIACYGDPHGWSDNCAADQLAAGAALQPCGTSPDERLCVASTDATAVVPVPPWFVPVLPDSAGGPARALVQVHLVASVHPDALASCGAALAAVRPDEECLLAVKRVVVSSDAAPNRNPRWAAMEVEGIPALPDTVVALQPQGADPGDYAVNLTVRLDEASIDDAVDESGLPDETFLDVLWYTDCGGFGDDGGRIRCDPVVDSGDPPVCESEGTRWEPARSGECHVHVVAYDGRGGVGWWSQTVEISFQ